MGMLVSESIARRAFDAVASAQAVHSVAELDRVTKAFLNPLGYSVIAGVNAIGADGRPNVEVLFGQSHDRWEPHYQRHRYAKCDAVIRQMMISTEPLFWSDLGQDRTISAAEQKVLCEAADFGLRKGFMAPLHNLDGSISAVLLMGSEIDDRDPDTRAASYVMSIYYGSIGRRLQREARKSDVEQAIRHLTQRQIECLKWVRAGKSSSDIGDMLGISARTVDDHVAAACARMGVRTRVQAVVEAALHGLFEL